MILFLDFDGVIHPFNQTDLFCREEHLARVLRDFPGVEVVISSSWRETHTLKNMLTFFLTDLRSRIVGVTPVIEIRDAVDVPGVRLREINKYLTDTGNQHRRWVALDDAPELFPPRCVELVLCDGNHGFGNVAEKALRVALGNQPIENEAEYRAALKVVSALVEADPKRGTPDGDRLEVLGALVEAYEAIPQADIPMTGLSAYIADLAKRHGVAYDKTGSSALAEVITRLSGDDLKPDDTEKLVIALRRANVIDGKTMVTLLGRYFGEMRNEGSEP